MDSQSKPVKSCSEAGYSLLLVVWHQLDRRRKNSESFGSRANGLESSWLPMIWREGAIKKKKKEKKKEQTMERAFQQTDIAQMWR
jgi:hypothetical protein